jgi:hypothetical protein
MILDIPLYCPNWHSLYTSTIGKIQDIREKPVRGKLPRRVNVWNIPDWKKSKKIK